jgi:putative tricarboxylic transport membrane protein
MKGTLWVALGIAGVGIVLLAGIPQIGVGAGYDRIGPRFFPYIVAGGSILVGAWMLIAHVGLFTVVGVGLGRPGPPDQPPPGQRRSAEASAKAEGGPYDRGVAAAEPLRWRSLAYLALACVSTLALVDRAGFVIAATLQFWLVARAFGSRRPARDAAIAALLALTVYLFFSRGLGLRLPAGVL